MTGKDVAGVIIALIALVVIGWAGYIWLTPGKDFSSVFSRQGNPDTQAGMAQSGGAEMPALPGSAGDRLRCDFCGMFAEASASYVIAGWSDGSTTHHDSWDCVFGYGGDNSLELQDAQVRDYASPAESPGMLDAQAAFYLYETDSPVEGSMPPYVAAFKTMDEANEYNGKLGGAVLTFNELLSRWNQAPLTGVPATDHSEMQGMSGEQAAGTAEGGSVDGMAGDENVMDGTDAAPAGVDQHAQHHSHSMACAYCGMFADKSLSHTVMTWSDGSHTHHDCWDCAVLYGREAGLELVFAQVREHGDGSDTVWLDAKSAWYLYDTTALIRGSMPPFVAAFASHAEAEAAQPELGGEVVDFTALINKWN